MVFHTMHRAFVISWWGNMGGIAISCPQIYSVGRNKINKKSGGEKS